MTTNPRKSEAGQATVEWLGVAVALVVAFIVLTAAGQQACTRNLSSGVTAEEFRTLPQAFGVIFKRAVEDITFLINLPF